MLMTRSHCWQAIKFQYFEAFNVIFCRVTMLFMKTLSSEGIEVLLLALEWSLIQVER